MTDKFTIETLCVSDTAESLGIKNIPSAEHKENLFFLTDNIIKPISAYYDIIITSGYRCPVVNKAVGGSLTSQHVKGEAVDIKCEDNAGLFEYIKDNLQFDQLIWEFGDDFAPQWVHVSLKKKGKNRKQILRSINKDGKTVYISF